MTEQKSLPWTWWWGYGATPGRFNGDFVTKEAAIEAVRARIPPNTGAHQVVIAEARPALLRYDIFKPEIVLGDFQAANEDVADDDGFLRDMEATDGMMRELQESLQTVLESWCRRFGVGRAYALEIRSQETQMLQAVGEQVGHENILNSSDAP